MVNRGGGGSRARAIDILPNIERLGHLDAWLVRAGYPIHAIARPGPGHDASCSALARTTICYDFYQQVWLTSPRRPSAGNSQIVNCINAGGSSLIRADDRGRCHGAGADRLPGVELRVLRRLRGAELAPVQMGS